MIHRPISWRWHLLLGAAGILAMLAAYTCLSWMRQADDPSDKVAPNWWQIYSEGGLTKAITPYVAEFLPGNGRRVPASHQHAGAEFLYMLSGHLRLVHEGRTEVLERGDAVYFDPAVKHSYERIGDELCTALILTIPEPMRASQPARMAPQSQGANGAEKKRARS